MSCLQGQNFATGKVLLFCFSSLRANAPQFLPKRSTRTILFYRGSRNQAHRQAKWLACSLQKKPPRWVVFFGRGGIRTPGTLRHFCFQDRRIRPLCHSSKGTNYMKIGIFRNRKKGGEVVGDKNLYNSR